MRSFVGFLALMLAGIAQAQQPQFQDDRFEEELPWMEIQAALPDYPEQADLIAVKGAATGRAARSRRTSIQCPCTAECQSKQP